MIELILIVVVPWLVLGLVYFLKLVFSMESKQEREKQRNARIKKLEEEIEKLKKNQ